MSDSRAEANASTAPVTADAGHDRYKVSRNVTIVGGVVNLLLAVAKIIFGVVGHSQALVADGVHSLSDLATDALVIIGAKHGSREADADHPYGHGRIETALTVALAVLLIAVGLGIVFDAVQRLFDPERLLNPSLSVLVIAGLSVLSKEALYHYTVRAAKQVRSNLLRANAWHHRTDAVSSVVVIVGVAGTMAGLPYLDAIAAVAVALMIIKIGWNLGWHNVQELVDTALDAERVQHIREAILSVDGVRALHMLRTRRMGGNALVDVHILVNPRLSVSEGHKISDNVRTHLLRTVDEVTDVTVHIDPEDDQLVSPSDHLPPREVLLDKLRKAWADFPESKHIQDVTLHYLQGRIFVELTFPVEKMESVENMQAVSARFAALADEEPTVAEIKVYFT